MKRLLTLLTMITFLAACGRSQSTPPTPTEDTLTGKITFAGSTTMQPLVAQLGDEFRRLHPYVTMDIAAGGSAVGIKAIHDGTTDIGMASRALTANEAAGINQYQVAIDVLALVVHPTNPIKNLTLSQLQDIFMGKLTNWQSLGGPDLAIIPVQRETSSGSRGAFDEMVLKNQTATAQTLITTATAGDEAASVAKNPGAIGYVGFGNIDKTVKVITINGILPTQETAQNNSYPLTRPLIFMMGPLSQPLAKIFIDYALSAQGQKSIQNLGWVPVPVKK
ncbi:MAG TPA: phosphate ABC transporter substrate-binding protein [Anaerolineales bacterium]|nr:phosphate ABC transporter substrate-binding protein [Anaerolineales bacterium]